MKKIEKLIIKITLMSILIFVICFISIFNIEKKLGGEYSLVNKNDSYYILVKNTAELILISKFTFYLYLLLSYTTVVTFIILVFGLGYIFTRYAVIPSIKNMLIKLKILE